jgi:hypothetical protein
MTTQKGIQTNKKGTAEKNVLAPTAALGHLSSRETVGRHSRGDIQTGLAETFAFLLSAGQGRAFSGAHPSAKRFLTAHHILCHSGRIDRRRLDDM